MSEQPSWLELADRLARLERRHAQLRRLLLTIAAVAVGLTMWSIALNGRVALAESHSAQSQPADNRRLKAIEERRKEEARQATQERARLEAANFLWRQKTRRTSPDVQQAKEFRVVDGEGRTRAILGIAPDDTTQLLIFDGNGKEILSAPTKTRIVPAQ